MRWTHSAKRIALLALILTAMFEVRAPTPAEAQYRAPQVYNPSHYNNMRTLMNNRAALRRYCRRHPRVARCRLRTQAAVVRKR